MIEKPRASRVESGRGASETKEKQRKREESSIVRSHGEVSCQRVVVDSDVVDAVVEDVVVDVVVTRGCVSPRVVAIGVPAPVSVAVVPVACVLVVSVAARVRSDGVPPHAATMAIAARAVRTRLICMNISLSDTEQSSRPVGPDHEDIHRGGAVMAELMSLDNALRRRTPVVTTV
jgi:hypothetical protein